MSLLDKLTLKINGIPISRVKSFNFLGIVLNENLTWTDHITHIPQNKSSNCPNKAAKEPTTSPHSQNDIQFFDTLQTALWKHIMGTIPRKPHQITKKAIRALTGSGTNAHTSPLLKELKLLSIIDIHSSKLLCLFKQIRDKKVPIPMGLIRYLCVHYDCI